MPLLSFSKVPRSNQSMKTWVNTSTEVAEYSHRSVESIWRRFEAKKSTAIHAHCSSPLFKNFSFELRKRSSKPRLTDPGSWVNLPTTFARLVCVLAHDLSPWKSLLLPLLFTPFMLQKQSTLCVMGVREDSKMREMKLCYMLFDLHFKCILYTCVNFNWISLAFAFYLNFKSQTKGKHYAHQSHI